MSKNTPPKVKSDVIVIRTYEECFDIINVIIEKKRHLWTLKAVPSVDFDDVKLMITHHIYSKWHLFDQKRSLEAWVTTITNNQFINILRNYYTNYTKPCNKCPLAVDNNGCKEFGEQSSACSIYAHWAKYKSHACNIKLPLSIESHINEANLIQDNSFDMDESIRKVNEKLKIKLKPFEYRVYKYLYIDNLSDEEAAEKLGYKTSEKNRSSGYKRIRQLKNILIQKTKEILQDGLD
jgi:hypothetical protein